MMRAAATKKGVNAAQVRMTAATNEKARMAVALDIVFMTGLRHGSAVRRKGRFWGRGLLGFLRGSSWFDFSCLGRFRSAYAD